MTEDAADKPDDRAAQPWLDMLKDAERAFQSYQDKCDSIDKLYSDLDTLAKSKTDREFQIFWANMEVLRPSIYSRPPKPVVVPRYRDRRELPRKASELLERVLSADVDMDAVHDTLLLARDDLAVSARGVVWLLDDARLIHVDRRDFLHEPGRKWSEVGWVARRAWLTKAQGTKRFGDVFSTVNCETVETDQGGYKGEKKAAVWEIWDRTRNCVVWVTKDAESVLDHRPPLFDVEGFFPCPRPAYGTLQRRTLRPVPDFVYYRDQVEEINELTARISSLSESLRMKGFYAAGNPEIGDAIEAAMKQTDNAAILVPVASAAALGTGAFKDAIVWLPVQEIAATVASLVELRRQLIQDVYEITGISDIMRGATDASETATAQQLKSQYGGVRVRERQGEMVRLARDVFRLKAEVYAEKFEIHELAQMAQFDLPDEATAQQQVAQMAQQAAMQAQGQGKPSQFQPPQIVTLEQVDQLLKSEKVRPFVLDVESDSTIMPDEQAEKQSRMEFIGAVGGFIQQAGQMVAQAPETADFAGEMLKFMAGGFRAGRELDAAIDQFVEQLSAKAKQPPPPDPEMQKMQMEGQAKQADHERQMQVKMADHQKALGEAQIKAQADVQKSEAEAVKAQADVRIRELDHRIAELQVQIKELELASKAQDVERVKAQAAMPKAEPANA